jgi:hypothetical protein
MISNVIGVYLHPTYEAWKLYVKGRNDGHSQSEDRFKKNREFLDWIIEFEAIPTLLELLQANFQFDFFPIPKDQKSNPTRCFAQIHSWFPLLKSENFMLREYHSRGVGIFASTTIAMDQDISSIPRTTTVTSFEKMFYLTRRWSSCQKQTQPRRLFAYLGGPASMINGSCVDHSNVQINYATGEMKALKQINPGDELLVCYKSHGYVACKYVSRCNYYENGNYCAAVVTAPY